MAARSTVMESNAFHDKKPDALKLEKAERRGRNQCLDVRDEQQQLVTALKFITYRLFPICRLGGMELEKLKVSVGSEISGDICLQNDRLNMRRKRRQTIRLLNDSFY